jgi:hypothetical protein
LQGSEIGCFEYKALFLMAFQRSLNAAWPVIGQWSMAWLKVMFATLMSDV